MNTCGKGFANLYILFLFTSYTASQHVWNGGCLKSHPCHAVPTIRLSCSLMVLFCLLALSPSFNSFSLQISSSQKSFPLTTSPLSSPFSFLPSGFTSLGSTHPIHTQCKTTNLTSRLTLYIQWERSCSEAKKLQCFAALFLTLYQKTNKAVVVLGLSCYTVEHILFIVTITL